VALTGPSGIGLVLLLALRGRMGEWGRAGKSAARAAS